MIRDSISDHCFSIIHLNIRSLAANFDHLTTLLSSLNHNFHIIGLSETKILKNKDPNINETIPGYSFFFQPTLHNAGGVGFYIREEIGFNFRDNLNAMTDDFECLWIEIHSKSRNTVCAIVYRHPNSNFENFKVYFTSAIDKISKESKIAILVADFNINLLNYDTHSDTAEFLNTLGSYCFQPHITKRTRITDHSATLIDHIYFNSMEHRTISGNILCDITDHLPNFLIINKFSYNFSNSKIVIYRRDYSNFASDDFLNEVKSVH